MKRRSSSAPVVHEGYTSYSTCPTAKSAAEFVPQTRSLNAMKAACQTCRGCPIYCNATQAVFGEGPKSASVVFVGEQPGDQEDLAGKPFVVHPSAILRAPDDAAREESYEGFVKDLKIVARKLHG